MNLIFLILLHLLKSIYSKTFIKLFRLIFLSNFYFCLHLYSLSFSFILHIHFFDLFLIYYYFNSLLVEIDARNNGHWSTCVDLHDIQLPEHWTVDSHIGITASTGQLSGMILFFLLLHYTFFLCSCVYSVVDLFLFLLLFILHHLFLMEIYFDCMNNSKLNHLLCRDSVDFIKCYMYSTIITNCLRLLLCEKFPFFFSDVKIN